VVAVCFPRKILTKKYLHLVESFKEKNKKSFSLVMYEFYLYSIFPIQNNKAAIKNSKH